MIPHFLIVYQEEDFPKRYCERLFGKNVTVEEAMAAMDENNDGVVKDKVFAAKQFIFRILFTYS